MLKAPDYDVFELSVFGPGVGECIVLHLGKGDWAIVDSCAVKGQPPIAEQYLESIGVPVRSVRILIFTHWHDDHVRGAAQLVEKYTYASVWVSDAIDNDEFAQILSATKNSPTQIEGASEIYKVVSILTRRVKKNQVPDINFMSEGKCVWRRNESLFFSEIIAASPSSAASLRARLNFSKMMPDTHQPKRSFPVSKNIASSALFVASGSVFVLLGADVESSNDDQLGWPSILKNKDRLVSHRPSHVYKVAHHGSKNAHHDGIWTDLLAPNPISVTTAYTRSRLPTKEDQKRISNMSNAAFLTSPISSPTPPARSAAVEKDLTEITKNRRLRQTAMGHVRFRRGIEIDSDWEVTISGPAIRLKT